MKIRNLVVLSFIAFIIVIAACRDDFDFDIASDELTFSKDTLSLDTVFNYTNSQTYRLSVFNNQNKDVYISKIYLSRGENSFFKINVDGMPGYSFDNVAIRKKDSILIFVEIAAEAAPSIPLYDDEIVFESNYGFQQVKLISYIEKAKFYNKELSENYNLTETNWDNEYARVLYGNINANDLNIGPKTKVYFHKNANLLINGNLNINGSFQNEVIFRTNRMDKRSDSLPDYWGKIKIKSTNDNTINSINYAVIKGGNVGLEIENSRLNIKNTKLLNNEKIGLYGVNSIIRGENLVINNSNLAALAIEGGDVQFIHSTFANYFNIGQSVGSNYSLFLGNLGENDIALPLLQANFYNCIFYGRASNAVFFENGGSAFNHNFKNNLIKLNFPNAIEGIDDSNIIDVNPMFVNPGFGKNDLRLKNEIDVIGIASPTYADFVPFDIKNYPRTSSPIVGAYQQFVETE